MDHVTIFVDEAPIEAQAGISVAAALMNAGRTRFRTSVSGEPRGLLCAMGICFECRVTIDGQKHRRACMATCAPGMRISTRG
jgi:D-hydroxyproline dehydrogenase subunit gamma